MGKSGQGRKSDRGLRGARGRQRELGLDLRDLRCVGPRGLVICWSLTRSQPLGGRRQTQGPSPALDPTQVHSRGDTFSERGLGGLVGSLGREPFTMSTTLANPPVSCVYSRKGNKGPNVMFVDGDP